jgi:hypothetical protein
MENVQQVQNSNLFSKESQLRAPSSINVYGASSSDVVTYGGVESGVALTLADRFGNPSKLPSSQD